MPEHLHILVVICESKSDNPPSLDRMVKQFKGSVTKKVGTPLWQKSFFEHIVRDKYDFDTKLNYIYNNPYRIDEI